MIGDYWTDGKRVVHFAARQGRDWCKVLIWADAQTESKTRWVREHELQQLLIGHRQLTPAEVRSWCEGGPVPAK